jgi:hypothetical protein
MKCVQQISMMIGGVQKGGTTSLLSYLKQHPEIKTHQQPEMSFFVNDAEFNLGYEHAWKKYFGALCLDGLKLVAKHVLLMYSQPAINRLIKHNADVQLVVSLRNPVDRAYSSYWYARRKAWEEIDSFEEALENESERLGQGWYRWRRNAYLLSGRYVEPVSYLMKLLGPKKLHVVTTDELAQRPQVICSALFEALGVDTSFEPSFNVVRNRSATARLTSVAALTNKIASSRHPVRNILRAIIPANLSSAVRQQIDQWNEAEFVPPPMRTDTRQKLIEYYRPYNEHLGKILGRDFHDWNS